MFAAQGRMYFKQLILSLNCLYCGSWVLTKNLYCQLCYDSFIKYYVEKHRSVREAAPFPNHIFLIEWHPKHSEIFDQLVYRIKSNNSLPALHFYADLLAELVQSTVKTSDFDALVPIAGSKKSSTHAHLIAERLALHFGLPVLDVIRKQPSEKAQKHMSAAERRQKNLFSLNEGVYEEFTRKRLLQNPKPVRFLLVDDILTTGISFQHGAGVLSGSEHNMIATLFYRPRTEARAQRN